jgi:hypothetical protein
MFASLRRLADCDIPVRCEAVGELRAFLQRWQQELEGASKVDEGS